MALSAPVLAPPRAQDLVSSAPHATAVASRRARRQEIEIAVDPSLDLFSFTFLFVVLYSSLPWTAELVLSRVPALFGIIKAPVAELQVQYGILVMVLGLLALASLVGAILLAPKRRWWHWPLFDSLGVALAGGLILHIWGANRLVLSACWGYVLPIPSC